jgi:hypothetical protein
MGLERGPLSLVSTTEELLDRKSSGSGLEHWDYGGRGSALLTTRHPSIRKSWHYVINKRLTLNASHKTEEDIEAIQLADWYITPEHTGTLKTYDYPILIKQKSKKKEDTLEVGTDYEHQRAKDYLTQELKQLLNNKKKKKIASKHSCKVLHQQNPLTIPCGR